MSASLGAKRLPPDVNRILLVKNLPFSVTSDEMYDLFGKYGAIRQVRMSDSNETKGTAFVVYEDIYDARNACTHLSGFNVKGRYIIVTYFKGDAGANNKKADPSKQLAELAELRKKMAAATD